MQTLNDLRFAIRGLLKRPGFTLVAVITLALGIGANTAIFSMLDAIMFRSLPVRQPEQLVKLQTLRPNGQVNANFSYPAFRDYAQLNQVCSDLIAYYQTPLNLSGGNGTAERIYGTLASGNYFAMLGIEPAQGRLLSTADDQTPGAHPVVVISYSLWQRRFGGNADAIGKSIEINRHQFNIIGVAPQSFTGTVRGFSSELWLPMMMHNQAVPDDPPDTLSKRTLIWLDVMGRLKPSVTPAQATLSLQALANQIAEANGRTAVEKLMAVPGGKGEAFLVSDFNKPLLVLMTAVGLVLLIACANVANLLLVRAGARRKEIAVRLALGATRQRLVRQLLTESILLALLGGAAGLVVALWADRFWLLIKPRDEFLPLTIQSGLNARVLLFALLASVVTGLLFGLVPALQSSKFDYTPALKDEVPSWRGERRFVFRDLLVVLQVAVSVVVLVGAGLFVRSLRQLQKVDVGFRPEHTLIVSVDPSLQGYDRARGLEFYRTFLDRVRALPTVRAASLAATVSPNPGGGRIEDVIQIEGQPVGTENFSVEYNRVGPEYFATMNMALTRGRDFTTQDRKGAPSVVVINETMARKIFPHEDPIGKRFRFGDSDPFYEVVGVARDGKYRNLREDPLLTLYEPFFMAYRPEMNLVVRIDSDPRSLVPAIRNELAALDQSIPLFNVRTLEEQVQGASAQEHTAALVTSMFGGLALLLAIIGLYGVMSYSV
ncbi:MAG TPA: ABC transporter permease, partial [Pyrinomonadaceae bacterium]|nr:ABC transporter permease [Pyrinomonadaceae bacterium]